MLLPLSNVIYFRETEELATYSNIFEAGHGTWSSTPIFVQGQLQQNAQEWVLFIMNTPRTLPSLSASAPKTLQHKRGFLYNEFEPEIITVTEDNGSF